MPSAVRLAATVYPMSAPSRSERRSM